jgi:hypothetical protein
MVVPIPVRWPFRGVEWNTSEKGAGGGVSSLRIPPGSGTGLLHTLPVLFDQGGEIRR